MKATISAFSAMLLALTLTTAAQAWYGYCPPPANAFSPNCCYPYSNGAFYGSGSNWPPYGQPFQGFRPPAPTGSAVHPFARSPRDYFMLDP